MQLTNEKQHKSKTKKEELELIEKLRKQTGAGMMDCKRALVKSNWKINHAKEELIAEYKRFII